MTRTCGWAARGKRLTAYVPHWHWKTLVFMAGLRHDSIIAPSFWTGPSTLRCSPPGSSSVSSRRCSRATLSSPTTSAATRPARLKVDPLRRCTSALPATHSPDLNPTEMVFAKLKTQFRKADERTIEASWQRVGTVPDAFTPAECQNYLHHAGYALIVSAAPAPWFRVCGVSGMPRCN